MQASLAKRSANSPEVYAFFRNRITFPIYDLMKNVVGFTARVVNPEDQPKYLNSAEHKAFNKSKILYGLSHAKAHLNSFQKLIVVEGQMDVIGMNRLGFPIGIATSGTSLTEEHIKIIKRHTENLYFLFDNDKAGQQATFRALKLCYQQDIFPKIGEIPAGWKDVDDIANLEDGKQIFETIIADAKDGFIAMFERLRINSDMNSPIDKQKLINAMFELIISVNDVMIQEDYKKLLADKLGFAPSIVEVQLQKYKSGAGNFIIKQQARQEELNTPERYQPSRELLFASLFYQEFLGKIFENNCRDKARPCPSNENLPCPSEANPEDFLQSLTSFSMKIAVALPESYLARVFKGELKTEEKAEIEELQLWREKELGEVGEQDTKKAIIQRVIAPSIQDYFKMGSKSPHLNNEEKMELNKMRIEIGKK